MQYERFIYTFFKKNVVPNFLRGLSAIAELLVLIGGADSFVSKDWWSICNILNIVVSHDSVARCSRSGEKWYIYFIGNSFLFSTVKEVSKSVNN